MSGRDAYLRRKYGITEADYGRLLVAQGGRCAICGKLPGRVSLAVDHDHQTGEIYGLLHPRCNRALAPFEWDLDTLRAAAYYLLNIHDRRSKWLSTHH